MNYMSYLDPKLNLPTGRSLPGILNLFGRRNSDNCDDLYRPPMPEISEFLLLHQLSISSFTLSVAHDCVTGLDPRLTREIDHMVQMGKPVTSQWLREARAENSRQSGVGLLAEVMNQLERNLDEFERSAQAARSATRDYGNVLAKHGDRLELHGASTGAPQEIVKLVRTIITHTQAIEQEMARSEQQSLALRKELVRVRKSADQDHLTGLYNRRAFDTQFIKEIERSAENGKHLCVGFCDIDHFKEVNDKHGHDTGDRVIRAVAQSLAKVSGDRCFVARHGGEEFAILFQDRNLQEAFQLFDEVREALAARRLRNRKNNAPIGPITISGGVTQVRDGFSPSELLREADDALYRAKREGRNRIIAAQI
jgi:diguanylate cyclase